MTALEYVIARQARVLESTGRKRELTVEEREFLRKVAPLLRRLAEREQKSVSRSEA